MKEVCFIINKNELCLEKNIIIFDVPLFFVCKDKDHKRYIVLCIDSTSLTYLVAETNIQMLVRMLESKITMRNIFEYAKNIWRVVTNDRIENDSSKKIEFISIKEDELPEKDAYLELNTNDIVEYKEKLIREYIHSMPIEETLNKQFSIRERKY